MWHQVADDPQSLSAFHAGLSSLEAKIEGKMRIGALEEFGFGEVSTSNGDRARSIGPQASDNLIRASVHNGADAVCDKATERRDAHPRHNSARNHNTERTKASARNQQPTPPATAELISVPPGSELGPEWYANPHEFGPIRQPAQSDVFRGDSLPS
jgi:hypothetical protein